jgi:peptide deformylase
MGLLKIIEWPAKVLETRAKEVESFDDKLKAIVKDMHDTLVKEEGIGLSANQVDVLQRITLINIPFHGNNYDDDASEKKQWWHDKLFTLINPVITERKGRISYMEGCMSFPDIFDFVERSAHIKVKAFDVDGKEFEFEATDLFSVCIQHEIDHLDGVVFVNRMSRLKSSSIKKKMMKRLQAASVGAN